MLLPPIPAPFVVICKCQLAVRGVETVDCLLIWGSCLVLVGKRYVVSWMQRK